MKNFIVAVVLGIFMVGCGSQPSEEQNSEVKSGGAAVDAFAQGISLLKKALKIEEELVISGGFEVSGNFYKIELPKGLALRVSKKPRVEGFFQVGDEFAVELRWATKDQGSDYLAGASEALEKSADEFDSAFPGMQLTRNIDDESQLLDRLSINIDDIDAAAIEQLVVAINRNITGAIR